jgi:hypothetical protein
MEELSLIATWTGWPVIVAIILLAGGYGLWILNNRIEHLKELNLLLQMQKQANFEPSDYGVKIKSINAGDKVQGSFKVSGTYKKELPKGYKIQLFVKSSSKGEYFPQRVTEIKSENRTWTADVRVGGVSGTKAVIIAAVAGPDGQALCNYYRKVGRETEKWTGIELLTNDIELMDEVNVIRE